MIEIELGIVSFFNLKDMVPKTNFLYFEFDEIKTRSVSQISVIDVKVDFFLKMTNILS